MSYTAGAELSRRAALPTGKPWSCLKISLPAFLNSGSFCTSTTPKSADLTSWAWLKKKLLLRKPVSPYQGSESPGNCSGSSFCSGQVLLSKNFHPRPGCRRKILSKEFWGWGWGCNLDPHAWILMLNPGRGPKSDRTSRLFAGSLVLSKGKATHSYELGGLVHSLLGKSNGGFSEGGFFK